MKKYIYVDIIRMISRLELVLSYLMSKYKNNFSLLYIKILSL